MRSKTAFSEPARLQKADINSERQNFISSLKEGDEISISQSNSKKTIRGKFLQWDVEVLRYISAAGFRHAIRHQNILRIELIKL